MYRKGRKSKAESGAVSVEAAISLTIFLIAIIGLMMLATIMRAQAMMQNALNQTAREISGYFYLLDRFGLTPALSGQNSPANEQKLDELNKSVGHIIEFAGNAKDQANQAGGAVVSAGGNIKNGDLDGVKSDLQKFKEIGDNARALQDEAIKIKDEFKTLMSDGNPAQIFKAIIGTFGRTLINTAFSKYVAAPVCEALMPKYLTSGDPKKYYESVGIDPDSVTFAGSDLLADGRTIRLVLTYKMSGEKMSFGFIPNDMYFQQVAVTAAWINPEKSFYLSNLEEVSQKYKDHPIQKNGGNTAGSGEKDDSSKSGEDSKP
ncbi:MAG: hypothetical protein MJ065_09530 [Oscillospiraceae bacterium]|nr:hypothetical protein [Oscillospiraceae bacterium]